MGVRGSMSVDVRDGSVLVVGLFKFERVIRNSRCQWPSQGGERKALRCFRDE